MIKLAMVVLTISFLLVSPRAGNAETVLLRAGEHGSFTRLVLDFEVLPEWRAGRSVDGYKLVLQSKDKLSFDTLETFRSIDRRRLAGLTALPDGRSLAISLGCDCAAEIFAVSGARLVVDIRPRPFGRWAKHEAALTDAEIDAPLLEIDAFEWVASHEIRDRVDPVQILDSPLDQRDSPILPFDVDITTAPRHLGHIESLTLMEQGNKPKAQDLSIEPDGRPMADVGAVTAIGNQLSRAISQGLVETVENGEAVTNPDRATEGNTSNTIEARNFRSLTIFDRDTDELEAAEDATEGGTRCILGPEIQVSEWGDPSGASELGKFRTSAIAENGQVTQKGRLKLARHYLALGFGSEARKLARGLNADDQREIIEAIAEILDHGESTSSIFDGQTTCQGDVALWALLAKPVLQSELPQSTNAILASFSALPRHLRSHLGPILSARLQGAGESENARTALNAVTRAGGGSRRQDLTAARLALIGTSAEDARGELERLTRGTDFVAAEALLELLLDAERRGTKPKDAWLDDAPSLVRATQGTDIAENLSTAALRGHVPLMRFDALRRSLNSDLPGLSDSVRASIAKLALSELWKIEDDQEFVRAEVGFSSFVSPQDLASVAGPEVLERMLAIGMYPRALRYLSTQPETSSEKAITSRVLVANGFFEQALPLVEANDNSTLAAVHAQILEAQDELLRASEIYQSIDDLDRATLTALQSADWDWLITNGVSQAADLVQSLHEPLNLPTLEVDPIENFGALVSRSKGRRESAQLLLQLTDF